MTMRVFASDLPTPRRAQDWEGIARLVTRLLEQRKAGYPEQVKLGNITQAEADRRIGVMTAMEKLWGRVMDRVDLPHILDCEPLLGANIADLQKDAGSARDRLAQIAAGKRDDGDAIADRELGEALWWNLQPIASGSLPHIWIAHEYCQWEMRQRRGAAA